MTVIEWAAYGIGAAFLVLCAVLLWIDSKNQPWGRRRG